MKATGCSKGEACRWRGALHFAMLALMILNVLNASVLLAQENGLSRSEYLQNVGLLETAADIEQKLRTELGGAMTGWPVEQIHETAAFFAYVLAVHGVTDTALAALEAEGFDIVHAITSDSRPLVEQALLTDLVVVGEVLREHEAAEPDDGFSTSTAIRVKRRLKGDATGDTILIRQRDRREAAGRDVRPEVGKTYLLLLSNAMYRFSAARHRASESEAPAAPGREKGASDRFTIYRIYELRNKRVDFAGFDRRQTERALEEIEWLDRRLRVLRPDLP